MMRRFAGLLTFAVLAVPSSAVAAPPGGGLISEPFMCGGVATTIVHSAGLSGWVGDQQYVATSSSFTPTGGATVTQTFGQKSGLSGTITCSAEFPEGTFTVTAVPVPPRGG